ncbi:MAG TPA: ABC transporter substrate-binding protein [Vicinamibacteria bacterium]|nr:ABC transporter substrate-binding protein [Vicinamibacteria bacterium]
MRKRWSGLFVALALSAGCRPSVQTRQDAVLRVAIHTEPQTWNRLLASDRVTHVIADQLHEPLLRLNPETQKMEPALAESWEFSEEGTRLVFHLRKGVRFSDGDPFGAEDVAFTFKALYEPSTGSPLVETAQIDGKAFGVKVIDESTVAFTLPRRTAVVERVFDSLVILPSHVLKESLKRQTLAADTGLGAEARSIVGLGPFVLAEHVPGERIVLERNPYYWRTADDRGRIPRLERLVFEIVPDENARLLRFRSGEIDLLELLTPDSFEMLRDEGSLDRELIDLGPGLLSERLWFNLGPKAPIDEHKRRWFADVLFRRAISLALDRRAMARVVFSGRATPAAGPVSPANFLWHDGSLPEAAYDPAAARTLLSRAGFAWDDGGRLRDGEGHEVSFTVLTNAGNESHARMGAFIQEDLSKIGIHAPTVVIEASSLLARITGSFDYEACLLGITQTDPDPSAEMGLWLSRAPLHLWNPQQKTPATAWEARIDELMQRQMGELDSEARRATYFEVQGIVYEQLPVLDLVVPHALLGARHSVWNLRPTPFAHALWNGEEISIGHGGENVTWKNP